MWEVDYSYVIPWLDEQDDGTVACIFAALEVLAQQGPSLGRPLVDTLKGSSISNLKELRPASSGNKAIRIIFAFDPRRKAVMLLAGDKSGKGKKSKWSNWYKRAIPKAETIWKSYLEAERDKNG